MTERATADPLGSTATGNGTTATTAAPATGRAAARSGATCSIIILAHNRASLTRQCLNAVLAQGDERVEREIVVVDDASTDLTPRLLGAYADRLNILRRETATGFAAARNAGAAASSGEYLVFLNNDTLPRAGWLRALATYAAAHPAAAVVGAKLLYPNDTVQHAGVVFGLDRYPHHLYAGFPASHPAVNKSRRFQAVAVACCLVRREAFEAVGGFDAEFDDGREGIDLCLRLGELGHEVHYCHESLVYHLEAASRERQAPDRPENRGAYLERWRNRVQPDDLGYYAADELLSASYTEGYPIRLSVSPLLAGIDVGDAERLGDRLLQERARQVAVLLQNNVALNMRVQEAELRAQAAELRAREAEARAAAQPTSNDGAGAPAAAGGAPSLATPTAASAARPTTHPIIGTCERPGREPEVVTEDFMVVAGWALSKAGIFGIETFVDGLARGHVDYGKWRRPDVAAIHLDYPDGENCGFIGRIPMEGLSDGEHGLVIRVIARDGKTAELATRFEVDSTAKASGRILVACDRPAPGTRPVVRDRLQVTGWALSPSGIRAAESFVDGERRGAIAYGGLRPDVAMGHPDYPNADHSGFAGSVPVDDLADGEHALLIRVTAFDGRQAEVKARFEVDSTATAIGEVPHINEQYPAWLRKHTPSAEQLTQASEEAAALPYRPKIGLIAPIGDEPAAAVTGLVDAVSAQVYDNWELCLVTDALTADDVNALLASLAASDPRIRVAPQPRTGLVNIVNEGLEIADGEFVAIVRHDDVLAPTSLFDVARLLNDAPDSDVIYGDEDKLDEEAGVRWDPFFKPDWSPDLLLSTDYLGPVVFYRRSLLQDVGGLRRGFAGAEGYDLVLRATERTDRIGHVPRLLSSRRVAVALGPTAVSDEAVVGGRKALTEMLARRGIEGTVEPGISPGRWRIRYALREHPGVTIVMPSGGKMQFLRPCLESLLDRTTYPNLHLLIVDNSEGSADVAELCDALAADHPNLRREAFPLKPFNFSAITNHGARLVETPYLILLNDDITVVTPDWVEAMLEHAQRPEVGVVGAKLLFPDDTFQHAGVTLGPYQGTAHAFKQFAGDHAGYFGLPNVVRNWSAVTFACAMMRKEVYDEVGGLDADRLPIAFNDTDMCLRVGERGYRVVYTPHAVLYHHESVTKKVIADPSEIGHLRSRWGHVIEHDPFYNPNLTRRGEDFSLNME